MRHDFPGTVMDITTGGHPMREDTWVGLIMPPVLVLFGTVLPKVGRFLGKKHRKFILEPVQETLCARIEGSESQFETAPGRG